MYKILQIFKLGLYIVFHCNIIKTLYLNFKRLPFSQAIRLPIWIYGKITFRSLRGKIIIDSDKIYPGMIKIGKRDYYVSTGIPQTILTLNGILKFKGNVNFLQGNYILVSKRGYLEIGTKGTFVGSNCKIICFDKIVIGNSVEIAWECQIMDTSFHYVSKLYNENEILNLTKPVVIGDNCWIGNRTTISKGTILPDYSIVASNSLVNKDFSQLGSYHMFVGIPVTPKIKCKRIYDKNMEKEYDYKYNYDRTHL